MEAATGIDSVQGLETSLSFLHAALESTADGILVVDWAGKFSLYNRRFAELWRLPAEILEKRDDAKALAFVTAQLLDPPAFLAKVRDLYSSPEATSFDVIRLTEGRTFERYSQPQWLGGEVVGRVWSFRDVTIRTRSELQLRQRTAELQAVLDNMLERVFTCDAEGRLFLVNQAARRATTVRPGQSLGELPPLLLPGEVLGQQLLSRDKQPLARALKGEQLYNHEYALDVGDGRLRSLRISAAPIRDESDKVVAAVAVGRDVTDEVELEHLKDQFVRVAAHEFKTPLAVMKINAQLALQRSEALPPSLTRTLRGINRGVDRLDLIVRSLLDLSQLLLGASPVGLERIHLRERIDLGQLLEEAIGRQGPAAQSRIGLAAPEGIFVLGSSRRLLEVLDALLENAVRCSPEGGEILASLQTIDEEAVVEIEDHGVGIAADKQAKIFERFYRAHSGTPQDYGGIGLGLFLAREIVRRHGGRMWFQSIDGVGSRFFVALPKTQVAR